MARDHRTRRTRRTRRGGGSAPAQPNVFSRLIPDVVERPAMAALGGVAGFGGNLAGDIKDAVVGLPVGLIRIAQDPAEAGKQILGATWQTYSPLFEGDFGKFAQGLYDHPLAPILDVAAVFSLGVGSAARGAAALEKAGSSSAAVAKIAKLRTPGTKRLFDPEGKRLPVDKVLSTRPGRRLIQETMLKFDGKLPQFYTRGRYERLHRVDLAHRATTAQFIKAEAGKRINQIESHVKANDHASLAARAQDWLASTDPTDGVYGATRLQMDAIIQGAQALEDITELGKRARSTVVAHMHANLLRHNSTFTKAEAQELLKGGHNMLVRAPEHMDRQHWRALRNAKRSHARATRKYANQRPSLEADYKRWDAERAKAAELANSHDRIRTELVDANTELARLQERANVIAGGYVTKTGRMPRTLTPQQGMRYETNALQDATDRVARLEKMNEAAYKAKAKHEAALANMERLRTKMDGMDGDLASRYETLEGLRDQAARDFYAGAAETYESMYHTVEGFGKAVKADNFETAAHVLDDAGEARYYVVPKHDAYNLAWEGGNSLKFIHKALHKPTSLWKSAVIGWTPRTITNNAVGNWFLYAVRELPSAHGVQAIGDAFRFRFGSKIDGEVLFPKNHWLYRHFSDEMSDTFGVGTELVRFGEEATTKGRLRQGPFYPVVGGIEKNQRAMTLYSALRAKPEVREAIRQARKEGLRGGKAVDRGIERALRANPSLQPEAALSSRRLMGDYITMSETEKFLRDIVPFYLWNRHILKTTGNMLLEQPGRVWFASHLSNLGVETTQDYLGDIPEYLKGAIPLAMLGFGDRPGRANIMLTASLNPFATVGEMAMQADALLSGKASKPSDVFIGVNPFFTGAVEAATGTSLLTGQRKKSTEGGLLGAVLSNMAEGLPQPRLLDALMSEDAEHSPSGYEYLYKKDDRSQISSLLGVPLRNMSRETAEKLGQLAKDAEERRTRSDRRRGG